MLGGCGFWPEILDLGVFRMPRVKAPKATHLDHSESQAGSTVLRLLRDYNFIKLKLSLIGSNVEKV